MAKQVGLIRVAGSVGDMTYYKSRDGYLIRERTSITAERIASDPKFKRTRENMAEFATAASSGKLMRNAVNTVLKDVKDGRMVARLTKAMAQVIKTDMVHKRGLRVASGGNLNLLKGFEFNEAAVLATSMYAAYTTAVDKLAGTTTIVFPDFVPANAIIAPQGATHLKIVSTVAAIDFDGKKWVSVTAKSNVFPWDETPTGIITLVNTITGGDSLPWFVFLGMQFLQEANGIQYPLLDGGFNALSLIEVFS